MLRTATKTASTLRGVSARSTALIPSSASSAAIQHEQRRGKASEVGGTSSFDSPFKGMGSSDTTNIPDFHHYKSKRSAMTNKTFSYFMVGSFGLLSAMGAKVTVQGTEPHTLTYSHTRSCSEAGFFGSDGDFVADFLVNMAASADVLAMAKVEVDLSVVPEGKNIIIKWRGKPVFIRHRTDDEVKEARAVKVESLRDPQKDEDRVKEPNWLVMVGT